MARTYEVPVCSNCGLVIKLHFAQHYEDHTEAVCPGDDPGCSPRSDRYLLTEEQTESVTAIDARDVAPLVEAAKPLAEELRNVRPDADGYCHVPTRWLRKLQAALDAFEDSEQAGEGKA